MFRNVIQHIASAYSNFLNFQISDSYDSRDPPDDRSFQKADRCDIIGLMDRTTQFVGDTSFALAPQLLNIQFRKDIGKYARMEESIQWEI